MVRNLLLTAVLLMVGMVSFAQTSLSGKVKNATSGGPVELTIVKLFRNGVLVTGAEADFDGNYRVTNLDGGKYDVEFSMTGFQSKRVANVQILNGKDNQLDESLDESSEMLIEVVIIEYQKPLFQKDNTTTGGIVTADEIAKLPTKNINGLIAATAGVSSIDGGGVNVRGSRSDNTVYFLDGIRTTGRMIPANEIEQLEVVTGGISAAYGDVTGGLVLATSRGPARNFSGGIELETSQFLDPFGYNFALANLSGPIAKKKDGTPMIGFRLSGQYNRQQDDDPTALDIYRVNDATLAALEAKPVIKVGNAFVNAAEYLKQENVNAFKYNPFEARQDIDLTGKLDFRLSRAVDMTISGNYYDGQNQFTPADWSLLNAHNNPTTYSSRYRVNFRLRHRLGDNSVPVAGENNKKSLLSNASYALQFGFERGNGSTADPRHEDRFFDYGYIGKFNYNITPILGPSNWSGAADHSGVGHIGNFLEPSGYTAGYTDENGTNYTPNPVNSAYNTADPNIQILDNGFIPTLYRRPWDLYENVGKVYNSYSKNQNDLVSGNATFNFDINPRNGSGVHNIQFGLLYEQENNSGYTLSPYNLWRVAQLQQNRNIIGVDTNNIVSTTPLFINGVIDSIPVFANLLTTDLSDLTFYKKVREAAGVGLGDYVNVDALDPRKLSLDMFSAQELNDQNLLDYYGYDYLGNKLANNITFNDFFTAKDANGIRTFPVGAITPTYQAGYIQDKFKFYDVFFRVGVRLDRYDANTKVLSDPYSLYPVQSASDFYATEGTQKPVNVGDDWKVYVTEEDGNVVKAFRNGDDWFTANGTRTEGNLLFGGGLVNPKYIETDGKKRNIRSRDYDFNQSFADYEAQVNISPRLAFSFPISDNANFFAHYDVLVQRPTSNTLVTALDYFYWEDAGRFTDNVRNNANLKPQRTIDYEVGFKQKLTNSSALTITAYYKEMRDMIQSRSFLYNPAPINFYRSYGNIDFGTTKGFAFTYDLRRTRNVQTTINYTLQFADGTGSDANSQRGLSDRGNIRTLFPLSFDERHSFNITMDYRYESGKRYNGPKWFGTDVFADAGINVQAAAISGRPYTAKFDVDRFDGSGTIGSINGARKPWRFNIDMRVDKTFAITKGEDPLTINVYFRVQNVLDTRNVNSVYPVTGSATDDGYLASFKGDIAKQNIINSGRDLNSFLDFYRWRVLNNDNFTLPRRMFLGMVFGF